MAIRNGDLEKGTVKPHRECIHVDGIEHQAPIPTATRVGNMLFTSGIIGFDAANGSLSDRIEDQALHVFVNLRKILEAAGGDLGDVGHVRVLVKDENFRAEVNKHWLADFPDPDDRPARHTVVSDLRGTMLVQLEVIAVLKTGHA